MHVCVKHHTLRMLFTDSGVADMCGRMETICDGSVRPYCGLSSDPSPFPGPVVPTHLLCKFNLDRNQPAESSSDLLLSQTAQRSRNAGLWGGLAALCVCLREMIHVRSLTDPKCLTHHGYDQKGQPRSHYYHSCGKHVRLG